MIAVVQRVTRAGVVSKKAEATIGHGLCVLLGVEVDDTLAHAPTQEEPRHGYVTFSCYGMDLVFPNSILMAKQTRDSLTAFTWGENYEPVTF